MTPGTTVRRSPAPPGQTGRAGPRGVWVVVVVLALPALTAGCKSGDKAAAGGGPRRDPLTHGPNLIAPTNLPVNDRGTAGGRAKTDPLLVTPTSGSRTGAGYTDDPERFKGSAERFTGNAFGGAVSANLPASLAGRGRDVHELADPPGGVPLLPAGGAVGAGELKAGADIDALLAELRKLGVRDYEYGSAAGGGVSFTARQTTPTGAVRQYRGEGPSAADAVRQVLDQVKPAL